MLTNTLQVLNSDLELITFKTFKRVIYASDVVISQKESGQTWAWSYFIICQKGDVTLDNKPNETCHLHFVNGIVGGKAYPKINVGTLISPCNVGKANEMNGIMRAIKTGDSKLSKKITEGYRRLKDKGKVTTYKDINSNVNLAPVPEQFKKDKPDVFNFPYWACIKYDGASLVCCYHPDFVDHKYNILVYTRNRKVAKGFNDIRKALKGTLKSYPGLFVVGEVYKKGMARNKINGIHSRNMHGSLTVVGDLCLMVFDCFYAIKSEPVIINDRKELITKGNELVKARNEMMLGISFSSIEERLQKMEELQTLMDQAQNEIEAFVNSNTPTQMLYELRQKYIKTIVEESNSPLIKLALCYLVNNESELRVLYKDVLKDNGEGLIVRKSTPYLFSMGKKKINASAFKLKPFHEAEYEIVNYNLGKGNAQNNIIFVVKTASGTQFSVPMNIDDEDMKDIYTSIVDNKRFKKDYLGKMLTVKYEKISEANDVPLFPKGLTIREDLD